MIRTGEWLRKRREEERYSRAQLAEMTGLSYDMIRSIELGRRPGSAEVWEVLNAVLDKGPSLSFDCDELIQERPILQKRRRFIYLPRVCA